MDWKGIELTDKQQKELKQTGKVTITVDQMKQLGFKTIDLKKHLQIRRELWQYYTTGKSD